MARKKVNLAYITNDAVRRATFKKRRRGLIKKVSELATLCDVEACIVIYGPHEARPEVWPSESEARRLLHQFRTLPEIEQRKKMMNQEGFLQQRAKKLLEQFRKLEKENRQLEMGVLMYEVMDGSGLHDAGADDAIGLRYFVDARLNAVYEMKKAADVGDVAATMEEVSRQQSWFPEMPPLSEHMMFGNNGGGGLSDMVQPYMDNGNSWMDPNLFNF